MYLPDFLALSHCLSVFIFSLIDLCGFILYMFQQHYFYNVPLLLFQFVLHGVSEIIFLHYIIFIVVFSCFSVSNFVCDS